MTRQCQKKGTIQNIEFTSAQIYGPSCGLLSILQFFDTELVHWAAT